MARYLANELKVPGAAVEGGQSFLIQTGAGPIVPVVRDDGQITVDMGFPQCRNQTDF